MHIEGLTKQDVVICDLLWNCDSSEAVDRMIAAMPMEHKSRAQVLRELMIAHVFDDHMEVSEYVKTTLARISSS